MQIALIFYYLCTISICFIQFCLSSSYLAFWYFNFEIKVSIFIFLLSHRINPAFATKEVGFLANNSALSICMHIVFPANTAHCTNKHSLFIHKQPRGKYIILAPSLNYLENVYSHASTYTIQQPSLNSIICASVPQFKPIYLTLSPNQ